MLPACVCQPEQALNDGHVHIVQMPTCLLDLIAVNRMSFCLSHMQMLHESNMQYYTIANVQNPVEPELQQDSMHSSGR